MAQFITPPKSIQRTVGRTLVQYQMIRPGDRVLLGLSGGKDSLSLLHILMHFQRRSPVKFALAACTIDPQSDGYDPVALRNYVEGLGIPYFVESEPIVDLASKHMKGDSYCAFCARMKRGLLYKVARREGYNVLALAQHLDDLAESFLMSAFHGGKLNTMKAHYVNDAGDVRIIRPLVRVRERQLADFAQQAGMPIIPENCPACFDMPTQRFHYKTLLAQQERANPMLFRSLLTAITPLMEKGLEQALATASPVHETESA